MRVTMIAALAALCLVAEVPGAAACGGFGDACPPSVVAWSVYIGTGRHIGVIEAPVEPRPHLETSRFTGQPIAVRYNNPGSLPGSIEPDLHLVPLPRAKRSDTVGAYPVGY